MAIDANHRQLVRERAGDRCEYCHLPAFADEWPFHVDHIVSQVHGGVSELANLAWCCTQCNLHKGPNLVSMDPLTKEQVNLFSPRGDSWREHFSLDSTGVVVGKTAKGRATVRLLDMNGSPQLDLRRELLDQGEFPYT